MAELVNTKKAAEWASTFLEREVIPSNICYLVNYAKISKYSDDFNNILINIKELKEYYENILMKERVWKRKLGEDLNWKLSFEHLKEASTTKHVHRLHPYKGKFIPQLVEYFLNDKTDNFKTKVLFKKEDIVLDPFMGSGTTLVQSKEIGIHSIGVDISNFNCLISEVKLNNYNIEKITKILLDCLEKTKEFSEEHFDESNYHLLKEKMSDFNKDFFPNPEIKLKFINGIMDEEKYSELRLNTFLKQNESLIINEIKKNGLANESEMPSFLKTWFSKQIRQELFFYLTLINNIKDSKIQNLLRVILSRVARSCRATTHFDLATLKKVQEKPYYCFKHKKICTPINNIIKHLDRYTKDTIRRLEDFDSLKKDVFSEVIQGDSRNIDIVKEIKDKNSEFAKILKSKKIDGIFTSPPYVGQINYHEQHAYAYELFNIERFDDEEIGPLFKGKGQQAQDEYVEGISKVLLNIKRFVKEDGDFFIVANDKHNLYEKIAEKSGLKIVNRFRRPVLNRTERDKQPYAETIFHMKNK